jgi:Ribosomal protein L14p/L23e
LGIANKVRRGDIRHAVVVRAKKEIQRKDGGLIRFDDNACVLINKTGDPIGTRLTSMPMLQSSVVEMLIGLQAWLELSYVTNSGRKYCRSHRYMYEDRMRADIER